MSSSKKKKNKLPESHIGSFLRIQSLFDAQAECERYIKAAYEAHDRLLEAQARLTDFDWEVFDCIAKEIENRGD